MEWLFPSAENVLGDGYPPFMVTIALGAELVRVTVIGWVTWLIVNWADAVLVLESFADAVWRPAVDAGTTNVQPKLPFTSVVTEEGEVV